MNAASAAQVADLFSAAMTAQIKTAVDLSPIYTQWLIDANIFQATHDGQLYPADNMPVPPTSRKAQREIAFIAQDAAVRRLWQRNRIVYSIDPDLWAELSHTDVTTEVPAGLFDRLPHPDPFIALPTPLVLPVDNEVRQRVVGFYVIGRGRSLTETQVSTHSPAAVGNIGLLIGGLVESHDGKPHMVPGLGVQDMIWTRATLRREAHTVQEMIDSIRENFNEAPEAGGFANGTTESIIACVSMLIYLCSVNAELRPLPSSVNKRQGKGKAKPPKVIAVGYEIGAALRAYRRSERAELDAAKPGTGRKVRPHIRRAHFHTYRVGAGRVDSIVKWLSPIPVKMTTDAEKTTVVKVD